MVAGIQMVAVLATILNHTIRKPDQYVRFSKGLYSDINGILILDFLLLVGQLLQ